MNPNVVSQDSRLAAGLVMFAGAFMVSAVVRTNDQFDRNTDMNNLKQIGQAQQLYSEEWGDVYATRPLVLSGAISRQMLVSPSDRTKHGYANLFRSMTKSPLDPEAYYRDSYLPISAVMNPLGISRVTSTKDAGWLVAFSGSEPEQAKTRQPCFSGTFLRLLKDGAVVVKKHHISYDFPNKTYGPFQEVSWWFTDDFTVAVPGFKPPADFKN